MTDAPRVAVCIPAYDETDRLRRLLASIRGVAHPADRMQVVVAVDGANPAVLAAAQEFGANALAVRPNGGSYAARNAAIEAIVQPVEAVLFTDADCEVDAGWVSAHLHALASSDLSGGGVRFTFTQRPSPAEWVDSIRHLQQEVYVARDGFAATCNLAVRWAVLEHQRFDASMRTGGDAAFCRSATAAGFRLSYTPEAVIAHEARRTRRELMTKVHRIADGMPAQRERMRERGMPKRARLNRGAYRLARRAGLDVGWVWGLEACLLNYHATRVINRSIQRVLTQPAAVGADRGAA